MKLTGHYKPEPTNQSQGNVIVGQTFPAQSQDHKKHESFQKQHHHQNLDQNNNWNQNQSEHQNQNQTENQDNIPAALVNW